MTTSAGPIGAFVSEPATCAEPAPPLLALHGISRDAETVFDAFRRGANDAGRVVIAPEFTQEHWRSFQRITSKTRPDVALLELLSFLRSTGVIDGGAVDLFGFSGGAQLAHRWAMLYPHLVSALHISSAGWYTLPQTDIAYPYGLAEVEADVKARDLIWPRRMQRGLEAFLRIPIRVYVGALDNHQQDPALRRHPVLDAAQGHDRVTRAKSYHRAFEVAAKARGIRPNLRFQEIPACGHSFDQCVEIGGLIDRILP